MKILILYTHNRGFLSNFFFDLSLKLSNEGLQVFNFSLKYKSLREKKEGVTLIEEPKGGYLFNYRKIYKIILEIKPDIVLSNFSYVNPSLLFGSILGVKKNMVWFHSLNNQTKPRKSQIFIKKQFLKLADIVIANSSLTKKDLFEIYKIPKSRIKILPFWTNIFSGDTIGNTNKYKKNLDEINIGCPGKLTNNKNQQIVIKALSELKEEFSDNFNLYFAGKGEDLNLLNRLSENNKISDKVSFLGHLSPEDMVRFYEAMDVIILPSLDEAFGLVFIETISLGVPVIVSSKFGALTFIDNSDFDITKFTFNPKSIKELKSKIKPYFENKKQPKKYFQEIYEKTFSEEVVYELVKNVIVSKK